MTLLLPIANALDCSSLNEPENETCLEIIQSNATEQEKQQLIADLIYIDTNIANHSFVYDWNKGISFDSAPYDAKTKSDGYIKDAWLKIVAVMPSILVNNTLLSPGIGILQSAFNYRVEIPTGTEPGDCRTDFNLDSNEYWFNVYLNDNLIGVSTLTNFTGSDVLDFKDTLRIQTVTKVNHFKWYTYCCKSIRNSCVEYCTECNFHNTEYRTHEVNLEDNKQAYQYWPLIQPEIRAVDSYHNTTFGILDIENFDAFSLEFENSNFKQFNYNYDVNVSLAPYDVFTLRANRFAKKQAKNLILEQSNDSFKFYVSNPNSCNIKFYDHFHEWEQSCNLDAEFPQFSITTAKNQFKVNETINISIEPKNNLVRLKYGDEEVLAKNNAQFQAKENVNRITAYLEERKRERIIHVKDENVWNFAVNLGVFSGTLYVFYIFLKKYLPI